MLDSRSLCPIITDMRPKWINGIDFQPITTDNHSIMIADISTNVHTYLRYYSGIIYNSCDFSTLII